MNKRFIFWSTLKICPLFGNYWHAKWRACK